MENTQYETNRETFKPKLYNKMKSLNMTKEEYNTFLLQGIKKELIEIKTTLKEINNKQ